MFMFKLGHFAPILNHSFRFYNTSSDLGVRPLMAIIFFVKVQNENDLGLFLIELTPWTIQTL